jgi:Ca2+-binding RTX toxin-like protein
VALGPTRCSAGPGNDSLAGGQASDLVDGGPGDDTLVGDVPNPETFLPPIPDPTPNFDTCIGGAGTDQALLCERTVAL